MEKEYSLEDIVAIFAAQLEKKTINEQYIARWDYDGSRIIESTTHFGNGNLYQKKKEKNYICSHCKCLSHTKSKFCPDCGYSMNNA